MNLINVVAPVFNERGNISEFVKQVRLNLELITQNYKITLIDDGSTDESWSEILNECNENNKVVGIKLSKNFGHHNAITAGIHNSDSEWTIVMDSDLQDRPEVIGELYEKAKEGFDVVFVSRTSRLDPTWYKIAQKMFYLVLNALSGMKFDSTRANFSIINSKVVNAFVKFSEQSRYFSSTIYWLGFNTTTINAKHGRRYSGKPSYTLGRRFKLARDIIISFSDRLLALASVLGLTSMIVGFVVISFILIILNESPEELIFRYFYILQMILTLVLLFLGSVVAIYLKEIFKETKSRPLYIIDKKVN